MPPAPPPHPNLLQRSRLTQATRQLDRCQPVSREPRTGARLRLAGPAGPVSGARVPDPGVQHRRQRQDQLVSLGRSSGVLHRGNPLEAYRRLGGTRTPGAELVPGPVVFTPIGVTEVVAASRWRSATAPAESHKTLVPGPASSTVSAQGSMRRRAEPAQRTTQCFPASTAMCPNASNSPLACGVYAVWT